MVKNIEDSLKKKGLRLPTKYDLPIRLGYKPELDCTGKLKADGLQWYQEAPHGMLWLVANAQDIIHIA